MISGLGYEFDHFVVRFVMSLYAFRITKLKSENEGSKALTEGLREVQVVKLNDCQVVFGNDVSLPLVPLPFIDQLARASSPGAIFEASSIRLNLSRLERMNEVPALDSFTTNIQEKTRLNEIKHETKEQMSMVSVYAFQILRSPSVIPTSFVSSSYNPTAVVKVVRRRSQLQRARVLGTRCLGK